MLTSLCSRAHLAADHRAPLHCPQCDDTFYHINKYRIHLRIADCDNGFEQIDYVSRANKHSARGLSGGEYEIPQEERHVVVCGHEPRLVDCMVSAHSEEWKWKKMWEVLQLFDEEIEDLDPCKLNQITFQARD
jgi:hypothetical protein